jgi:hypothetical protein
MTIEAYTAPGAESLHLLPVSYIVPRIWKLETEEMSEFSFCLSFPNQLINVFLGTEFLSRNC